MPKRTPAIDLPISNPEINAAFRQLLGEEKFTFAYDPVVLYGSRRLYRDNLSMYDPGSRLLTSGVIDHKRGRPVGVFGARITKSQARGHLSTTPILAFHWMIEMAQMGLVAVVFEYAKENALAFDPRARTILEATITKEVSPGQELFCFVIWLKGREVRREGQEILGKVVICTKELKVCATLTVRGTFVKKPT